MLNIDVVAVEAAAWTDESTALDDVENEAAVRARLAAAVVVVVVVVTAAAAACRQDWNSFMAQKRLGAAVYLTIFFVGTVSTRWQERERERERG